MAPSSRRSFDPESPGSVDFSVEGTGSYRFAFSAHPRPPFESSPTRHASLEERMAGFEDRMDGLEQCLGGLSLRQEHASPLGTDRRHAQPHSPTPSPFADLTTRTRTRDRPMVAEGPQVPASPPTPTSRRRVRDATSASRSPRRVERNESLIYPPISPGRNLPPVPTTQPSPPFHPRAPLPNPDWSFDPADWAVPQSFRRRYPRFKRWDGMVLPTKKFYVIRKGFEVGIFYDTWDHVEPLACIEGREWGTRHGWKDTLFDGYSESLPDAVAKFKRGPVQRLPRPVFTV